MNNLTFLFTLLILISGCSTNKKTGGIDPETSGQPEQRLHDIWAIEMLEDQTFDFGKERPTQKWPTIEIQVSDMRFMGNDGCNEIFGKIIKLNDTELGFAEIGGTKMYCPNMEIPEQFRNALLRVSNYRLDGLKLYLLEEEGRELMRFRKVD